MKKLISCIALLVGLNCLAETYTNGGLTWSYTLSSGKATLTGVSGGNLTGALAIPASVGDDANGSATYPVIAIAANSFQELAITSLTFGESIQTINYGAFADCTSLESVTFPNSLTALNAGNGGNFRGAFNGCTALRSVTFGLGLVTIGNGSGNSAYNGTDSYADTGAFGNCDKLETVTFGPNLKTIGQHAFSGCIDLSTLTFPDSLQTIGPDAFYNNIRLTKVVFGANLQTIGQNAFMGCVSLTSVSFSPATTPLLTIKSNAFRNCVQLASLTLSNAMPTLESGTFANCTMLRRVTIPSLMSTIDNGVFNSMNNLKEVIFLGLPPENLVNAGLASDVSLRYPEEYEEDWLPVIASCGFTNATVYKPSEIGGLVGDTRYGLSATPADRSIASITLQENTALDNFVLENGKVYDCIIRIVNTAATDIMVTLPDGYVYESFKSATPLTIPANSRNILTITRTSDTTFLVTREELAVVQQ